MKPLSPPAKNTVRAFIGVPVDRHLIQFFAGFRQQHAGAPWAKAIRWLKDDNIHLTLRFLGNINHEQLTLLRERFSDLEQPAFAVQCSQPKPFPNLKQARMLASLIHKSEPLQQLANTAEQLAQSAGLTPEKRPVLAHITVARFKNLKETNPLNPLMRDSSSHSLPLHCVRLYQSELLPTGAQYQVLAEQALLEEN